MIIYHGGSLEALRYQNNPWYCVANYIPYYIYDLSPIIATLKIEI